MHVKGAPWLRKPSEGGEIPEPVRKEEDMGIDRQEGAPEVRKSRITQEMLKKTRVH